MESRSERAVEPGSEPAAADLVSVIIPVYNVAPYVQACLSSVASQSYRAIEIIVVDDGSTDESGEFCDRFAADDDRCTVIHQRNGGLSLARNVGLEAAHGRFVTFVDSDDYLSHGFLAELVRAAKRTEATVVVGGCIFVTEHGAAVGKLTAPTRRVLSGRRALLEHLRAPTILSTSAWGKLFQRSLFADHQLEFPAGKLYEDNYLTPRIYRHARSVVQVATSGYNYRQRGSSICGAPLDARSVRDWIGAPEAVSAWLTSNDAPAPLVEYLECYRAAVRLAALNAVCRVGTTRPEVLAELLAAVRSNRRHVLAHSLAPIRTRLMLAVTYLGFPMYRRIFRLADRVGLGIQRPTRTARAPVPSLRWEP